MSIFLLFLVVFTCNDEFGGMADTSLSILSCTRVIANVVLADTGDPQFRTVVGYDQGGGGVNQLVVTIPEDLWDRRPFG